MYKIIVFDFGNVILDIEMEKTEKALSALLGIQYNVMNQGNVPQIFLDYEMGLVSESQFFDGLKSLAPSKILDETDLLDAWNALLGTIAPEKIQWIMELRKKGFKTALLSNTNHTHIQQALSTIRSSFHGLDFENDCFDYVFYSHEIHLRKPNPDIYLYVEKQVGLKGSEILFIDDNRENILAAQTLGWNCIWLQDRDLLIPTVQDILSNKK